MATPVRGPMRITVNGEVATLDAGTTVAALVAGLGRSPASVAVAVDEEVVPRSDWSGRRLRNGERVEVLAAVQGG